MKAILRISQFLGMRLRSAVAGLSFAEESDRYAYRRRMYVLTLVGDSLVRARTRLFYERFLYKILVAKIQKNKHLL
ncbi:hypothetical protein [Desulfonema magnum]|uniref:Uncharacterized protein n=1 Tax=Desulfonema magnum TaxID=45655 RepID=A0A975GND9_9BACT|nr:hypothetical protein [Desulfonema magnum]QTA86788.1 Uncharacterized protein dnm_028120 [Desulfonema magnum]